MDSEYRLLVKIARKITEIPASDWLSVFPQVLENYYFFKTLDESQLEQFSFYYILVYENGRLVGATSCFLMRFPLDMSVEGPLKTVFSVIKKILPNIFAPKVLFCGLPMGQGRIGIAGDPRSIMEAVYDSMEGIANQEKAAMHIFKDFTAAYEDTLSLLLEKGFTKVESLPSTEMGISFHSFDEYMKTLSRVSRDGLKRKFKKIDGQVKIELEISSALSEEALLEVYQLYLQTFKKQDMGLEKVTPEFFRRISENMPNEVKYFLWRMDRKIVAFAFCLVSQDHFIDYYLGFDYSLAYQYHLYFVRFRDLMRWCIAHKMTRYEMGVTTYEPKRRLGFEFVRLYFYMKHRNRLINPFFKIASRFMKPENFDPVFKEMKKKKAPPNNKYA